MRNYNDLLNTENTEFSNFIVGATNVGRLIPVGGVIYDNFSNADGDADDDLGEADTTEPSGDDIEIAAGEEYLLPKLKQLVREKKLALKAQYGKGSIELTHQVCKKVFGKNICAPVPTIPPKRKRGWRYQWKHFKFNGGKAQLKQMAKGLIPIPSAPSIPTPPATPPATNYNVGATKPASADNAALNNSAPISSAPIADEKAATDQTKVLGMATSIGVPILIAGILVVGVGAYFGIRYFIKSKAKTA